eukprot:CAMPEP_0182888876 /NCGR_PEP_ID=MMETSP0034_2-20130328/21708_1 /TAXON_ID=156128 /ORGANISM="Nephroselmis pyriformis, Strain CCMP717" /LENGTH=288 /DNA_ID=CAMNT_0025022333 /DNA_START=60 /DNA_END=923 /DNA_ORIENTATION=-
MPNPRPSLDEPTAGARWQAAAAESLDPPARLIMRARSLNLKVVRAVEQAASEWMQAEIEEDTVSVRSVRMSDGLGTVEVSSLNDSEGSVLGIPTIFSTEEDIQHGRAMEERLIKDQGGGRAQAATKALLSRASSLRDGSVEDSDLLDVSGDEPPGIKKVLRRAISAVVAPSRIRGLLRRRASFGAAQPRRDTGEFPEEPGARSASPGAEDTMAARKARARRNSAPGDMGDLFLGMISEEWEGVPSPPAPIVNVMHEIERQMACYSAEEAAEAAVDQVVDDMLDFAVGD